MTPEFETALNGYLAGVQTKVDEYLTTFKFSFKTTVEADRSRPVRYLRVVRTERDTDGKVIGQSVHTFIDTTNGDILKGSWKAPVRNGRRGSIYDDNFGLNCVNHHGPHYLR